MPRVLSKSIRILFKAGISAGFLCLHNCFYKPLVGLNAKSLSFYPRLFEKARRKYILHQYACFLIICAVIRYGSGKQAHAVRVINWLMTNFD